VSEETSEYEYKFLTYLHYLTSLRNFLKDNCQDYQSFGQAIASSGNFRKIQGGHCQDIDLLKRVMRNAWFTEVQLNLPGSRPELITYSNHWAPVQLYYACFLSLRGFFLSSGSNIDKNHIATLRTISSEIERRPSLFLEPISVMCKGDPEHKTEQYPNLPSGISINRISSLSPSERVSFYDSYCMFLRTTRNRQIETAVNEWKKKHRRKKIGKEKRKCCVDGLPSTTIFDVLYRLRIRSNYADADLYLLNISNECDAVRLYECFTGIAWHTLFVFELIMTKYLGKRARHINLWVIL